MKSTTELFEEAKKQWETFEENHNQGKKVSATRARKASNELGKIFKDYRKASIEENK